jgi:hypothetical protein
MKRLTLHSTIASSLLSCALTIGSLVSPSNVLAQGTPQGKFSVPFDFQVGTKHMQAGTYTVAIESDHLMRMQGTTSDSSTYSTVIPEQAIKSQDKGRVVFHRYGNRYFFQGVWAAGQATGHVCLRSRAEKEILRAANNPAPSAVQLALNQSH